MPAGKHRVVYNINELAPTGLYQEPLVVKVAPAVNFYGSGTNAYAPALYKDINANVAPCFRGLSPAQVERVSPHSPLPLPTMHPPHR